MLKALYTAASGMAAQQSNIDIVSNNMSNVNTSGYKKNRAAFKDAMYSTIENRPDEDNLNLHSGSGVRVGAALRSFKQGGLINTSNPLDLAIDGSGFFTVGTLAGRRLYTRDGGFTLSSEDGISRLVTAEGYYVLDELGQTIELPQDSEEIQIAADGRITVKDSDGLSQEIGRLGIAAFNNPQGLEAVGTNLYEETAVSGQPEGWAGHIKQGFLENSNVEVLEEMTRLIMAQRAYQMNSRVLQTADEMERQANNLRG